VKIKVYSYITQNDIQSSFVHTHKKGMLVLSSTFHIKWTSKFIHTLYTKWYPRLICTHKIKNFKSFNCILHKVNIKVYSYTPQNVITLKFIYSTKCVSLSSFINKEKLNVKVLSSSHRYTTNSKVGSNTYTTQSEYQFFLKKNTHYKVNA